MHVIDQQATAQAEFFQEFLDDIRFIGVWDRDKQLPYLLANLGIESDSLTIYGDYLRSKKSASTYVIELYAYDSNRPTENLSMIATAAGVTL